MAADFSPWTPFEDNELLNLVEKFGKKKWSSVAAAMTTNRNRFGSTDAPKLATH